METTPAAVFIDAVHDISATTRTPSPLLTGMRDLLEHERAIELHGQRRLAGPGEKLERQVDDAFLRLESALVDHGGQYAGLPRSDDLLAHAVRERSGRVVGLGRRDPRFRENPPGVLGA